VETGRALPAGAPPQKDPRRLNNHEEVSCRYRVRRLLDALLRQATDTTKDTTKKTVKAKKTAKAKKTTEKKTTAQ